MPYFTGKGDKGYTIVDKKKFSKDDIYFEILGELDEFNSLLGFLKNLIKDKKIKKEIFLVQNDIFIIQANISWFIYPKFKKPEIKKERIEEIENKIKEKEKTSKTFCYSWK
jgi:cob(I)alamin adenosyltransferase